MSQSVKETSPGEILPQNVSNALVAVGSNKDSHAGNPTKTLNASIDALSQNGCVIRAVSRIFVTPCYPPGAGPDFVNAAVSLDWAGDAKSLLQLLHQIEAEFGRERQARWAQRSLDLDLIGFEDVVEPSPEVLQTWIDLPVDAQMERTPGEMLLPHPRLQDRAFVLVPLAEVAADWRHPVLGKSVQALRDALPAAEIEAVKPLVNPVDQS